MHRPAYVCLCMYATYKEETGRLAERRQRENENYDIYVD